MEHISELKRLIKKRKRQRTAIRTNLGGETVRRKGKLFLKEDAYSNAVREGVMLDLVRKMLPHAGITGICVNWNVTCGRHRDRMNSSGS